MIEQTYRLAMADLTALFGTLTDAQYTLYWQAFCGWDDARFRAACAAMCRAFVPTAACPFPSIGHISASAPAPEPYHRPVPQIAYNGDEIPDAAWVQAWRDSLPDYCKGISNTRGGEC